MSTPKAHCQRISLCVALLSALIATTSPAEPKQGTGMNNDDHSQAAFDVLAAAVARNDIGRLEVVWLPASILTRSAMTPHRLEASFRYKIVARDMSTGLLRKELAQVLSSVKVYRETRMADLRWGVIFFGRNGERVGAVYVAKNGEQGAVNDIPCRLEGGLLGWLRGIFKGLDQFN
ncbi:MAG: hypothetical protein ABFC63_09245 [Thermoguttaceae bacterium]